MPTLETQPRHRRVRGFFVSLALLIEDDSATVQSIELMLKSEGFNVYTTDLGEEGVDLGKLYDYDIILLDLKGIAEIIKSNAVEDHTQGICFVAQ